MTEDRNVNMTHKLKRIYSCPANKMQSPCASISFGNVFIPQQIKTWLDGTQSKVRIGNYFSSNFPIKNGLSALLFNFSQEYAIREVQETRLGLDMNGTHQVLAYVDDVIVIGNDIKTIERNAGMLLNIIAGTTVENKGKLILSLLMLNFPNQIVSFQSALNRS